MAQAGTSGHVVARGKRQQHDPKFADDEFVIQLTPNQIVAHNLAQARMWKNWTQENAAQQLEPYLGVRWSKATFSAAERSVDGVRVRQFTAHEIVAFSRGFGLPVGFFFLPPPPSVEPMPSRLVSARNPLWGVSMAEMVDVVFGTTGGIGLMGMRVEAFFRQTSADLQSEAQRRLSMHTEAIVEAVVDKELDRFDSWRTMLITLANQLGDWERRARQNATKRAERDG